MTAAMKTCGIVAFLSLLTPAFPAEPIAPSTNMVRVAAAQAAKRVVDFQLKQANDLARSGRADEAIVAFERLRQEYRATWIDRRSQERLAQLQPSLLQPGTAASREARPSSGAAGSEAAAAA